MPFFPRVLGRLVGLGVRVRQWAGVGGVQGVGLHPMPPLQPVPPAGGQLAGQPGGGAALADAAADQDDRARSEVGLVPVGAGEGVEDPAAVAAAIVKYWVAVAAVAAEPVGAMAAWTGQAGGMKEFDKPVVAGLFVHQRGDREVDHGASPNHPDWTARAGPWQPPPTDPGP